MKKIKFIFIILFISLSFSLYAESHVTFTPSIGSNIVVELETPACLTPGAYYDNRLYFYKHSYDNLQFGVNFSFSTIPAINLDEISFFEFGPIISYQLPLLGRLNIRTDASTGLLYSTIISNSKNVSDTSNGPTDQISMYGSLAGILNFFISPNWALTCEGQAVYDGGLGFNYRATVGASFLIPKSTTQLEIVKIDTTTVVPAFKNYYLDSPVLRVEVKNLEHFNISKLTVTVERGNLNENTSFIYKNTIKPGKTAFIYIPIKWNDAILYRTQTTMESLNLSLSYKVAGKKRIDEETATCLVLGRNNFIWQTGTENSTNQNGTPEDATLSSVLTADDSKTAVFVDPNDPQLIAITHVIKQQGDEALTYDGLPAKFRMLNQVISYLQSRNIKYQVDPDSVPYGDTTQQTDYLRYASDTLDAGYGDCDDLSILTASLLESSGVPTSFITIPGHIFVAADSGLDEKTAEFLFGSTGNFIDDGTTLWIPIEVTILNDGFKAAWDEGAKEWSTAEEGEKHFYPLEEAWKKFKPVTSTWWFKKASGYKPADSFGLIASTNRTSISKDAIQAFRAQSLGLMHTYNDADKATEYSNLAHREFVFGEITQSYDDIKHALQYNKSYSNLFNAALIAKEAGDTISAQSYVTSALAIKQTDKAQTLLASLQTNNTNSITIASVGKSDDTTRADKKGAIVSWEE